MVFKDTKAQIISVQNSKGRVFHVGQRFIFSENGEYVTVGAIKIPITPAGEYRLKIHDKKGICFASFDIELAMLFLTEPN